METILSDGCNVNEWCQAIINLQQKEQYDPMISTRDENHIVKKHIQEIMDYLKTQGHQSLNDVNDEKIRKVLKTLLDYLQNKKPQEYFSVKEYFLSVIQYLKIRGCKDLDSIDNNIIEDIFKNQNASSNCLNYKQSNSVYRNEPIDRQNYALFSFKPTQNCKPDNDGIYGAIKIIGTYVTKDDAEKISKELIKFKNEIQLFLCDVGAPIFMKNKPEQNLLIIDNDDSKYGQILSQQDDKQRDEIKYIKKREEELRKDVSGNHKKPIDKYLELTQKRATYQYMYEERENEKNIIRDMIIKCRKDLKELDDNDPTLKKNYMDHYQQTCKECGIDQNTDKMALTIKKYFGKDPVMDFDKNI